MIMSFTCVIFSYSAMTKFPFGPLKGLANKCLVFYPPQEFGFEEKVEKLLELLLGSAETPVTSI